VKKITDEPGNRCTIRIVFRKFAGIFGWGGICDRIFRPHAASPSRERVSGGPDLQARLKAANGRRSATGRQEATYKHYKYYGRFHLSGAVPRGGRQNQVPSFDEGVREGRGVRRTQDPQGRSQGPRTAFEGGLCRRVVLPARRASPETAQHSRRPRSHRQRQVRGLHDAAEPDRLGRRRTAHLPGHRHGHLHRPQGRGCLDGGRRRRVHRPGRLRDLQGP